MNELGSWGVSFTSLLVMTNRIVQLVRKLIYTFGEVGAALWSSVKLFLIRAEGGDSCQLTCRTPWLGQLCPLF